LKIILGTPTLLLLLLVWSLPAQAQAYSPSDPIEKSLTLDPIVVAPGRRKEKLSDAPRSVNILSERDALEQQASDLPDLMKETPGVFVQRTNRGAGSPIIRGLIGPQNLIVVDGIRFNTATFRTGPNQYMALLDPHAIRSIEVLLGPSSVLYGSGAMGGVVYVHYQEPEFLAGDDFGYEGQMGATFQSADLAGGARLRFRVSVDDFAFSLGGSFNRFDGLRAGDGVEVPNSDYTVGYWQAKALFAPSEAWSLSAAYAGMLMRDAGRTDKFGKGEIRFYDNDDHLAYLRLNWDGDGVFRKVQVTTFIHQLDEFSDRYNCETTAEGTVADRALCEGLALETLTKERLYTDDVTVIGANSETQISLLEERLLFSLGVDFSHDTVSSRREDAQASEDWVFTPKSRGNFSDGSTYMSLGTYLHAEAAVVDSESLKLKLQGGTRFSSFSAFAPDVPGVGDVDYDHSGLIFSGGLQLLVGPSVNIYTSFTQGFRAPNLQETTVLGDTGSKFEIPNPELGPERADTVELGSRLTLGMVDFSGAFFVSFLDDAIDEEAATWEGQSEIDATPVVRRVNAAEGQSMGVEARLGANFWRMRLASSLTWMTSELTKADGTTTPSRRTPPLFGHASLRYNHPSDGAYVELGVRWAGEQADLHPSDKKDLRICETSYLSGELDPDCAGSDGWAVLNVRGGFAFMPSLRAELSISNTLDTFYKPHGSGTPAAGADARLTLTSSF
jgi:outer membrane receptor protein involved in Fe transport